MRKLFSCVVLAFMVLINARAQNAYQVSIDLRKVSNDRVNVRIQTPRVSSSEITFHLPKIVPGTYAIHNYGAFITNFKAFDRAGNALVTEHPDVNSWRIQDANRLFQVTYEVNDTWDSPEIEENVFEPSGTDIQVDSFFLLNTFGFIGYLQHFENRPYKVQISKPSGFYGSSSLRASKQSTTETDVFETKNYQALADAPILYAQPDTAWLKVDKTDVLVSVYWKGKKNMAKALLEDIRPVLNAHKSYLGGKLPVKKYAFLVYVSDKKNLTRFGALEHAQSCFTFLPGNLPAEEQSSIFKDIAAHEFLHILTPLNIHSEEIGNFDFIDTKMSKHLWLYEGLTEYAAHHSQLRAGVIDLPTYLQRQVQKINNANNLFNDTLAFTELSLGALDKYEDQYQNVYEKGALIGLCLDVLLLQRSNGKYGTRELMQDLSKKYGPKKSFKDAELFDQIAALSYPEVRAFFRKYVENGAPLPLAETFAALGMHYNPRAATKKLQRQMSFVLGLAGDKKTLVIRSLEEVTNLGKRLNFMVGDTLISMNGQPFDLTTYQACFDQYAANAQLGDTVRFEVKRKISETETSTITLRADLREETEYVIRIEPAEKPSPQDLWIRSSWMGKGGELAN